MNKMLHCSCGETIRPWSYTILRVVAGLVLAYHGYVKVFSVGIEAVTDSFVIIGVPAANFFAYVVSYGELIAGVLIILGLFTHWAAKYAALVMLGAIYLNASNGFDIANGGYEYQLMLLAVYIYLISKGDGNHTIKKLLGK